jgi:thiopeptide-type bacteriocin biosynthesis protein
VTGADPAALVAAADPATAHAVREATALDAKIVAPQAFRDLSARVRALAPGIAADRTLHVDSTREGSRLTLGDAVLAEAYRAVGVLHPLARVTASDEDLARFRTAFSDRYGDAEVPLLTALDDETGIGYGAPTALAAAGAPLLAGLNPAPSTEGEPWTPVDHHLVDLLSRALRTGARELELGPADLGPLRNQDKQPLAEALAVVATVAAASAEAVAAGEFRLVVHGAYADGAGLVARFDPDLVARHVAAEEALRPGAAYAEVVHLPDGRNANVAVRPALRRYAIPVLGLPGGGERIGLDDLRVSVRDGRVVLRSVRLRREVVPRLTAAHDYRTTRLPVYRFLGAVGHDRTAAVLRWSWGQLGSAPYLPRVTVGRLVLARAQWRWFRADLAPLQDARTTAARYAALQALRDEWDVPRWVALARGEQELPLDLDGVGAAELLGRAARTAGQLILRELLPGPDDLCVTSAEGALVHDFVLPVTRRAPAREPRAATVPREPGAALLPGREWLGVRLLTGAATADAVLREVVAPLAMASDEWWYERRPDAVAPHLLLRLRGDAALHAALLDRAGPLVAEGRVHGVELDTYRPEPADAVAHADSVAALLLVTAYGDLDARWRAALWGIDGLLESAGIDVASRRALVRDWRDDLVARYGETGARAHRYAGRVHRQRRTALEAPDATTAAVLAQRADAVRDALADAGDDVLRRVASRHVNRLLRAAHGVQELVLYDLLDRTYAARLSRD